jgi:hypothetical protein
VRINAMNLKDRFRDVETDCRNRLHDLAPPNRGRLSSTHIPGADAPVEEPSTASEGGQCNQTIKGIDDVIG